MPSFRVVYDHARFFPCVPMVIADGPEAAQVLGLYGTHNCKMPCRLCRVEREDLLSHTSTARLRAGPESLRIVKAAERVRKRLWLTNKRRRTDEEKASLEAAKARSLRGIVVSLSFSITLNNIVSPNFPFTCLTPTKNPFVAGEVPMGSQTAAAYGATPQDLLHGWCAGIIKTTISGIITLLLNFSHGDEIATLESRMRALPVFPIVPGFERTKFRDGTRFHFASFSIFLYHIASFIIT